MTDLRWCNTGQNFIKSTTRWSREFCLLSPLVKLPVRIILDQFLLLQFREEFFYHVALWEFCNFGKFVFDPPLPMRALLLSALKTEAADWEMLRPNEEIAEVQIDM